MEFLDFKFILDFLNYFFYFFIFFCFWIFCVSFDFLNFFKKLVRFFLDIFVFWDSFQNYKGYYLKLPRLLLDTKKLPEIGQNSIISLFLTEGQISLG